MRETGTTYTAAERAHLSTHPPVFQRRHFEFIAAVIRESAYPLVAVEFANALAETNPNFDRERFLRAAGRSA